jgi:hypothetical protein
MLTGVRFRTYPTKGQAHFLNGSVVLASSTTRRSLGSETNAKRRPAIDQSYTFIKTKELPPPLLRNSATRWYAAKERGVEFIRAQKIEGKKKRKVSFFKKSKEKLGQERPKVTHGEMR